MLPVTILLYAVIAVKVHDEIQKQVHMGGQTLDVWPYPGWAFFSAFGGGLLLLLTTCKLNAGMRM